MNILEPVAEMKSKEMLLSAVTATFLAGCGDNSPSGPSGPVNYFPIAAGNRWNNDFEGYFVIRADTIQVTGSSDRTTLGTTTHAQGFQLWKFEQIENYTFTHPDTIWVQTDTIYTYAAESDSEIVAYDDTLTLDFEIVVKLPVTVGETWQPYSDDNSITRQVESVSVSVSVPAGNFTNCLHLRDTDSEAPDDEYDMWVAPNVGPCRVEADSAGVTHVELELQSYVVN